MSTEVNRAAPERFGNRLFRASTPQDAPAIVELMAEAGLRPNVEPRHLQWKYWDEREDWPGSRSYVLADGDRLLAHGGVIPARRIAEAGRIRVMHIIDWAARRTEPGAGITLMKHIGGLADALLAIGGSASTLQLLPLIGFRRCGFTTGYVRTLHPLRLVRGVSDSHWRTAARLARSTMWCLTAPRAKPGEWNVHPLSASEVDRIAPVLPREGRGLDLLERTEACMRYMLRCPIAPMALHALERAGRVRGYFLLAYAPGQARLVDCWMDSEKPADWRGLVHSVVREASRNRQIAELVTWANDPLLSQSLIESGFRTRLTLPIYLRATAAGTAPGLLRVQMLDNDAAYLHRGHSELWA